MKLARVIGEVVSTIKHPTYDGRTLLYCRLLTPRAEDTDKKIIAVDRAQAGVGDTVLILDEGNGARQLLGQDAGPIRALVVGVVDAVELDG